MTDREELAETEASFRETNEAIARTAERFGVQEPEFLCECADPSCVHRVAASLEAYEEVRSDSTRFIVEPGHERPEIEKVVGAGDDYRVVEKTGGLMRAIVRHLDPRRLRPR